MKCHREVCNKNHIVDWKESYKYFFIGRFFRYVYLKKFWELYKIDKAQIISTICHFYSFCYERKLGCKITYKLHVCKMYELTSICIDRTDIGIQIYDDHCHLKTK